MHNPAMARYDRRANSRMLWRAAIQLAIGAIFLLLMVIFT